MAYPRKYPVSGADSHVNENDWNAVVDTLNGFSSSGTYAAPFSYIVTYNAPDYSANNAFQVVYGGPSDTNGVDGANLDAVIQAAIDAAHAEGGGLVALKLIGSHTIDAPIQIYDDTPLRGAGKSITTLKLADNTNDNMIETVDNQWMGPNISDLTLDGNKDNNAVAGHCISIANAQHGNIEHVTIEHAPEHGIYVVGAAGYMTLSLRFNDINIEECAKSGIYYGAWAFDALIVNSNFGNNSEHNLVLGSTSQVVNSHSWSSGECGIVAYDTDRVGIHNCVIEHNGQHGVWLYNADNCKIIGNTIEDNGGVTDPSNGVEIGGSSTQNTVVGNSVTDNDLPATQNGIGEADTADYNTIFGNSVVAYKTFDYNIIGSHTNILKWVSQLWSSGRMTLRGDGLVTDESMNFSLDGDNPAHGRAYVDFNGKMGWGAGGVDAYDAWLERTGAGVMKITNSLNLDTSLLVAGTKVVGAQAGVIADVAVAGAAEDSVARQKINDILAMLRTHGLIDT